MTKIYTFLSKPESNGKKIGLFRIICSIFGGLVLAYLAMTALALILPGDVSETAIVSIMFNTLIWACTISYIALSPSKLSALLRSTVPSLIFILLIYILS